MAAGGVAMSGLTLSVTSLAGTTARYQLTNAEGAVVKHGAQRIHRMRPDAKPKTSKRKGNKR